MADSNEDPLETGPFFGAGLAAMERVDKEVGATTLLGRADGVTNAHAEATEVRATAISIFMIVE